MHDATDPGTTSGVRIFPPAIFIGGLVIGYALQWLLPLPILPGEAGWIVRIVGAVLVVGALAMMLSAIARFRHAGTSPNPTIPTTALALDGPYRFTRNPMYLGMSLLLAGLAGVGNALWPLLAVVPAVIIVRTQVIAREERYLEARFGDPYRAYTARVRRWV